MSLALTIGHERGQRAFPKTAVGFWRKRTSKQVRVHHRLWSAAAGSSWDILAVPKRRLERQVLAGTRHLAIDPISAIAEIEPLSFSGIHVDKMLPGQRGSELRQEPSQTHRTTPAGCWSHRDRSGADRISFNVPAEGQFLCARTSVVPKRNSPPAGTQSTTSSVPQRKIDLVSTGVDFTLRQPLAELYKLSDRVDRVEKGGMATAKVCRRHGIGSATTYKWKSKFDGLEVSDVRGLWSLEKKNSRLKQGTVAAASTWHLNRDCRARLPTRSGGP